MLSYCDQFSVILTAATQSSQKTLISTKTVMVVSLNLVHLLRELLRAPEAR